MEVKVDQKTDLTFVFCTDSISFRVMRLIKFYTERELTDTWSFCLQRHMFLRTK